LQGGELQERLQPALETKKKADRELILPPVAKAEAGGDNTCAAIAAVLSFADWRPAFAPDLPIRGSVRIGIRHQTHRAIGRGLIGWGERYLETRRWLLPRQFDQR
jgi:hypothetical protein